MSVTTTNPSFQSPLNLSSKDKFIMILELPYILRKRREQDPIFNIDSLQMSVFGTVVPDVTVPETDIKYGGQNLHLSTYTRPSYPPLTLTYMVDNSYRNYYLLWKWLDIMNSATESLYQGSTAPTLEDLIFKGDQFEYQTNISVIALDEYNKPTIQFNYYKAFITKLGGLTYSYKDGSTIESTANFHYSQMTVTNKPTMNQL